MSGPDGPTGVIVLKKIADTTYEQYGQIVLSATGITQITMSATTSAVLFQPAIEDQVTWIEEFASRVQSGRNTGIGSWQGGAWATQGGVTPSLPAATLLDGAVDLHLTAGGLALPEAELASDEVSGLAFQQITSHVSRNPTFYQRWAQTSTASVGMLAIGWHRGSQSFVNTDAVFGGIFFRHNPTSDIEAVCCTRIGATQFRTTMSTGVTAAAGVYHTGRMVVTGGGTAVEFFLDGTSKGTITTNIPTESGAFALVPGFASSVANNDTLSVDYMALSQQRTP